MAVIGAVRREKAERRMPLNTTIKKLTIYAGNKEGAHILNQVREDIEGTCKTEKIDILSEEGDGKEVPGYPNLRFATEY